MMYMHYCKHCQRVFMLNGHKVVCPKCIEPLTELRISYLDYVNLNMDERSLFKRACTNEQQLETMGTTYRMYKYSKWYKALQTGSNKELPIAMILANHIRQDWTDNALADQNEKEAFS